MKLEKMGWNDFFNDHFVIYKDQGLVPGRILKEARHLYQLCTSDGVFEAEVSGHFHYTAIEKSDFPTVGDWVAVRVVEDKALIEKVLPRKTSFSRKAAGSDFEKQVVAANIDYLCIVCGLDGGRNFNLRGIERYVTLAREGDAEPILVLNKVDLCEDRERAELQARNLGDGIPFHMVSAHTGEGLDNLSRSFSTGSTVVFTGHSGVGKSSLINALMGDEVLKTGRLRDNDLRGRHTTTHKALFFLKGGAMVIDTPGMRELQLWGDSDSLEDTFSEIYEASKNCHFKDCSHQEEPGCAVHQLLAEGSLEHERYQNYLDMRAELNYLNSKLTEKGRMEKKVREKDLAKLIRNFKKK